MMAAVIRALQDVNGHGESQDGTIAATVGLHGDVRALNVDPRVYRVRDPDALADAIVEAVRAARADADSQAFRIAAPLLPGDLSPDDVDVPIDIALHELDRLIGDTAL